MFSSPEWHAAEQAVEASEQHRRECWHCLNWGLCDDGRELIDRAHRLLELADKPVTVRLVSEMA